MSATLCVLAVATRRNGGTLPYSIAMIESLRLGLPKGSRLYVATDESNREYDHLGVDIVRFSSFFGLALGMLLGRSPLDASDVVVAPVYSSLLLACRKPYFFTLHDMQERYYPEYFSLSVRIWRRLVNSLLGKGARGVFCESDYVRNDIVRFVGVPAERIAVIPSPPSMVMSRGRSSEREIEDVRRKFKLPKQFIFYPAQFWAHKNHDRLLFAFSRISLLFPECQLVLTGQKRDEYWNVMKRANDLSLGAKVRHLGHVETVDIPRIYSAASVAVIPTLFESISIPVYEAFAVGCPVCVSAVCAIPEQAGGAALLFDPKDPIDMVEKVSRVLGSTELASELSRKGRARMESLTNNIYGEVLWGEILARSRVVAQHNCQPS